MWKTLRVFAVSELFLVRMGWGGDRAHVELQTLIWGEWKEGRKRNCPDRPHFPLEVTRHFVFLSCCCHTEFAFNRESVGRKVGRCWCHTLRDSLGCTQLPSTSDICATCCTLPVAASAGCSLPRSAEELLQQNGWRICYPQEVLGGQQEATIRVLHCTWKGLVCLLSVGGGKKRMRCATRALQSRYAIAYWSNFPFRLPAWEMSSFHYP